MDSFSKTKILLMGKSPFISSIAIGLKHELDENIPTAGTNGTHIKYNPNFWGKLSQDEKLGLMAHEAWHVALMHPFRENNREHTRWNKAADHVINNMLIDQGYTLPEGGLHDPQYKNQGTEEVYNQLPEEEEGEDGYDCDLDINADPAAKMQATTNVAKAIQQAKLQDEYGNLPAGVRKLLDDILNPKLSWKQLLNRFVAEKAKEDYSWRRPNKRYLPTYLPSLYSEALGPLLVAIDTSGSIYADPALLAEFMGELRGIHEDSKPSTTTVLDIDTEINDGPFIFNRDDLFNTSIEVKGGGGTYFHPAFEYGNEMETPPLCLIYFTDGYADTAIPPPAYDTLWVVYDNPGFKAPFGEVIYV